MLLQIQPRAEIIVWIGMALLAGLAIFIVWDGQRLRRGDPAPLSRDRMRRGVLPGYGVKWQIQMGVAFMALGMSALEWLSPSNPPHTGKGSILFTWAHEVLGPTGKVVALLIIGIGFFVSAVLEWRRVRRKQ